MKLSRKLMLAAAALAVPVSMIAIPGVASAAKTGTGTVTCTGITGSISFKPALKTTGPFSAESSTAKFTLSGCSGGSPAPSGGKVKQTLSSATSTNSCTSLATSAKESITVKWKGAAPSTTAFPGYTTGTGGPDNGEGFILTGGTVTGSYAGTGAKASAFSNMSQSAILAACGTSKGLTKLTIVGGSSTT